MTREWSSSAQYACTSSELDTLRLQAESTEVKPDFYISVSSIDAHCTDCLSAHNGLKASLPCKHPATPAYSERGIVNFAKHSGIQEFSAKLIKHTGPAASSSSAAAAAG